MRRMGPAENYFECCVCGKKQHIFKTHVRIHNHKCYCMECWDKGKAFLNYGRTQRYDNKDGRVSV